MSQKEKFLFCIAYAATVIITLLPFYNVGFITADDFQYYNTAREGLSSWLANAESYARNSGRFYFLLTKYFYYVPYIIDNYVWTKFVQFSTLIACYFLFSYIISRIFKSHKLGALTFLFLIFNTAIGGGMHYPTVAYPFYFPFSFMIFLTGILLFIKYTETENFGYVWGAASLFFTSYLFYENYLLFSLFFCCYLLFRNGHRLGWTKILKSKTFYKEMLPFVLSILFYIIIYFAYKQYIIHTTNPEYTYGGIALAGNFSISHFFTILNKCTFYVFPGRIHYLNLERITINSLSINGFYDNFLFILTHASALAYVNALIQCLILYFLIQMFDAQKISWKQIGISLITAFIVAYFSHVLIAISEKYNTEWYVWMEGYVTSFYSYFGIMFMLVMLVVAGIKICKTGIFKLIFSLVICCLFFYFSVENTFTNEHLSREWLKSQNRVKVLELMAEENYFNTIPEGSIIYTEDIHNTSFIGLMLCEGTKDFEKYIELKSHRSYLFATNEYYLKCMANEHPDRPIYYIQTTESKKNCELLMVCSHSSQLDTTAVYRSTADKADIFYYSPTKDFSLFYRINNHTDSMKTKCIDIFSSNKHNALTHVSIQDNNIDPFGFTVSNMLIATKDTLILP